MASQSESNEGNSFRRGALAAAALGFFSFASFAQAGITFDGSVAGISGTNSASAYFQQSGSDLLLTLTNTRTTDVTYQADVLTAVFFDLVNGSGATIQTL